MHTACWLFGWIIEPTTAKLAFCSQFHLNPEYSYQSVPTNDRINQVKQAITNAYLHDSIPLNIKNKLTFKSYNDKASILFNGSSIQLTAEHSQTGSERFLSMMISPFLPVLSILTSLLTLQTVMITVLTQVLLSDPCGSSTIRSPWR